MTIPLVLKHQDFIVINKPPGIAVQNEAQQTGILPLLCEQYGLPRLWLVHRLDKVTSGLLLLATNAESAARLSQLFAQRQIEKYYLAVTAKKPAKSQGVVCGDMKKIRDGKWALRQTTDSPAVSQFFSSALRDGKRLILLKPATGKTHQLRVALKSQSSPILGDIPYSGSPADRTYLHAFALSFDYLGASHQLTTMPLDGIEFVSEAFNLAVTQYRSPWSLDWPNLPASLRKKIGAQE